MKRKTSATNLAGDHPSVMSDACHVSANILSSIVDSRVQQGQERQLDELSRSNRHHAGVLAADPEFDMIE